ncbi:MAG: ferredoxin [Candidatus Synechococcus spongiarum SP3]|uniref:Ferredoxin n=1 Tax=Candidatus Synechococcus spongiarum SP3 TaxID=1604020 RepID=A0A0G2HLT9_9SYNE|nr:MAG: ferredoxin [Candidatus Synechococcus spongiarum SP3]
MGKLFTVVVHDRQQGRTITAHVPEGKYVLHALEAQGNVLPFSCRNGCCTTCAVRIKDGVLDHREALGLSMALREQGYGLLCVAKAVADVEVETQDEDEVYDLQFGRHFGRGRVRPAIPLEEE